MESTELANFRRDSEVSRAEEDQPSFFSRSDTTLTGGSAKREESPESPGRHRKIKEIKGCYVEINDAADLPLSVFEASDIERELKALTRKNAFDRCGRNSVMLNLGKLPEKRGASRRGTTTSIGTVAHYVKTSNDFITWMYLAVVIGPGILGVSKAISYCGVVPAMFGFLMFTLGHIFVCHRIVEIPRLVEENLETFSDIAKVCFQRAGWFFVWIFSVSGWFCACYLYMTLMESKVKPLFDENANESLGNVCVAFGGVVILLLVLRTSNDGLWLLAKLSLGSVVLAVSIECVCAIAHAIHRGSISCKWFGAPAEIVAGYYVMSLSFAGVCIIPYIVGEIVDPQKAKKGLTRACWIVFFFYTVVGMICYIGWGDFEEGTKDVLSTLHDQGGVYVHAVRLIGVLYAVKTIASYPIFFWPLCREIESYWCLEESPEVELRLPWASRHMQRKRTGLRVVLVSFTLCPFLLTESMTKFMLQFVIDVPIFTFFFGIPMFLALGGICTHRNLLRTRNSRSQSLLGRRQSVDMPYFCKNWTIHVFATSIISAGVFVACVFRYRQFFQSLLG